MSETTDTTAQNTADEPVNNTGAQTSETDTATTQQQAQPEKTFTQADVDRIVQNRLKSAVKAELKKLAGDGEAPNVEELKQQLADATNKARAYEASTSIRDYVTDPKNKLNVKAENIRAIEKLVLAEIEYDDDGKPSNLREAIESVKSLAPALFAVSVNHINQGNGGKPVATNNMNDFIRQIHAGR